MSSNKYLQHSHDESAPWFDDGPLVKRVVRVGDPNVNGIDTSAIDAYRQGVELTTMRHFDAGIGKISSGEPGHLLKQSSFGGAIARRQIETLKSYTILTPEWTPLDLLPFLMLKADTNVTPNGTDAAEWADMSGHGWIFKQTTASKQPVIDPGAGPGGKDAITFHIPTSETMVCSEIVSTETNYTIYAIYKLNSIVDQQLFGSTSNKMLCEPAQGEYITSYSPSTGRKTYAPVETGDQIIVWKMDGTSISVYRDGEFLYTQTARDATEAISQAWIGSNQDLGGYCDLSLSEIGIIDRAITDEELSLLHNYAMRIYGTPSYVEPLDLAPDIWLRSDMGVSLSGTDVTAWLDQSGNGNDFVGHVGLLPTYTAGDIPTINFNGAPGGGGGQHFDLFPGLALPTAYTTYVVGEYTESTAMQILWDLSYGIGPSLLVNTGALIQDGHQGVASGPCGYAVPGLLSRFICTWTGTRLRGYQPDNSLHIRTVCTSIGTWDPGNIMSIGAYGNGVYGAAFKIREFIYWRRALSYVELDGLRRYMLNRYGV